MPVQHRNNRHGVRLDAVENCEREPPNSGAANLAKPDRVEIRIRANPGPARLDLAEELQPKPAFLEFVPEELNLQFELRALADA